MNNHGVVQIVLNVLDGPNLNRDRFVGSIRMREQLVNLFKIKPRTRSHHGCMVTV